jgi:hypothetical protein
MGGKPFRSGFQRLGSHRHCGPGGLRSLLRLPFEAHRGNPLSQSRTAENRRTGLLRRRIATADGIDRSFRLGFPGCHASGCYCTRPPVHAGAQVVPRGAGPSTAAGFGRIAGRRRRLPEPTRAAFGDESPSPHLATSSRNRKPVILPSGGVYGLSNCQPWAHSMPACRGQTSSDSGKDPAIPCESRSHSRSI